MRGAALAALLLALPGAAQAQQRIGMRSGEHPGYGRLVFETDAGTAPQAQVTRAGERLRLRFPAPATVSPPAARRPPRNATAIAVVEHGVEITLRSPEVRLRQSVIGRRLVIDLLDPPRQPRERQAGAAAGTEASAPAAPPAAEASAQAVPPAPEARTRTPAAPAEARMQAPATATEARTPAATTATETRMPAPAPAAEASPRPQASAALPEVTPPRAEAPAPNPEQPPIAPARPATSLPAADAVAVRLVLGPPGQPRAVLLPFGEETGIAILRRGETLLIVIDAPRALNLAALRGDPVFGAMEARGVPGGSVLSLRLAEPATVEARRRDGAWSLTALPAAAPPAAPPLLEALTDAPGPRLLIRHDRAGRIVALPDPQTGLPLLVGTVRAPGFALGQLRRLPEADLLPSQAGLAALARSDSFALRATSEGFVVTGALALDPAVAGPEQQPMTRLFDIPALPAPALLDRLRAEHAAVRAAPPLGRTALRRAAAETLLALGMPQEAQGMLSLAAAEDPAAAQDPALAALAGFAALLAVRLPEAEALDRPDLPERDETILWRGLLAAARGDAQGAAAPLAATLPLALAYPEGLRSRLLGPIAATLAEAGHVAGLRRLVALGGEAPALGLARAALAEAEGRRDQALAGYEAVAAGRDRQDRARALRRGIELRLASGAMTAEQAADALDATLFAWRGDMQEISARLRIAALRQQAGTPRSGLTLLQETAQLFPEQAATLRAPLQEAFLASLEAEAPLAAVALHDANTGMMPADARGDATLIALAERLAALDLPERAAALLRPAIERAAPGSPRRAELGLRLAQLQFEEGAAAAALAALHDSAAAGLAEKLARERALLAARAEARLGRREAAAERLQALGAAAAEPLAELLAEAQDWAGAARAQAQHLAATLPDGAAPLDATQARAVLRQAALLALAGDAAGLAALAAAHAARLPAGPLADAFGALTADPMRGLADLPRLQRELKLFRALPARAEPLRAASLGTR